MAHNLPIISVALSKAHYMNAGIAEEQYLTNGLPDIQKINPALSEVVVGAFGSLRPVGAHRHEHVH